MTRVARTLWLLAALACDEAATRAPLSPAELLDPQSCKDCHPKHYAEWSGSMHAYAMADPVFLAMNARGQRETDGELGDFCVKCHAPMAVRENAIKDFADLTDVPEHLQGVTCYFCHNVKGVGEPHNNGNLMLAGDNRMRGAFKTPVEPYAHRVEYSKFIDSRELESALMCGSCHDIEMPNGLKLERTLQEWQGSIFALEKGFQSCSSCHTQSKTKKEPAAEYDVQQVPARFVHEHTWPGVDVALTEFPNAEAQRVLVERCMFGERTTFALIVERSRNSLPGEAFAFEVFLEATNVGHNVPSGASQDRRLWLEVHAFDESNREVFVSGAIADDELEHGPQLLLFRDRLLDEHGEETHMFWRAAKRADDSLLLPTTTPANQLEPHGVTHPYVTQTVTPPVRLELKLRMRPMGRDVLQDLVDSGDLDPAVMDKMPTFTVAEWEGELNARGTAYDMQQIGDATCEEYEQLMYPNE